MTKEKIIKIIEDDLNFYEEIEKEVFKVEYPKDIKKTLHCLLDNFKEDLVVLRIYVGGLKNENKMDKC